MVELPEDGRLASLVLVTPQVLDAVTKGWPRSPSAPPEVTRLLNRAAVQFRTGAATYDDFTSAFFTALQACELSLKHRLGSDAPQRATLGTLIAAAKKEAVLEGELLSWFQEFALHFRNRLAHPDKPLTMTPGMAEGCIRSAFAAVTALFPGKPR